MIVCYSLRILMRYVR